jgi:hypothetical protein
MSDGLSQPKYKGIWHVVQTILHEKDCSSRSKMGNLLVGGTNFYRVSLVVIVQVSDFRNRR